MSEIEQLKKRIDASGPNGVETAFIRDDYMPVGDSMIRDLTDSGEYVQRKVPPGSFVQKWKIFSKGMEPYDMTPFYTICDVVRKKRIEANKYGTPPPRHILMDRSTWNDVWKDAPEEFRDDLCKEFPVIQGCVVYIGSYPRHFDSTPVILEVW